MSTLTTADLHAMERRFKQMQHGELEAMEKRFQAMQRRDAIAKAKRSTGTGSTATARLQTKALSIGYEPARLALQSYYDGIAAHRAAMTAPGKS